MKFARNAKKISVAAMAFGMAACGGEDGTGGEETTTSKFSVVCESEILARTEYMAEALVLQPAQDDIEDCAAAAPGAGGAPAKTGTANINANDLYELYSTQQPSPTTAFAKVAVAMCAVKADEAPSSVKNTTYTVTCDDGSVFNKVSHVLFNHGGDGSCNAGTYDLYKSDVKAISAKVPVNACSARINF